MRCGTPGRRSRRRAADLRFLAGTSGYDFDEWRGGFYPDDLPKGERLAFYAGHLPTVEVNNTFYRMPKREVVARWRDTVPEGFTFVLKASRRITHVARLRDSAESVDYLWKSAVELGDRVADEARIRGAHAQLERPQARAEQRRAPQPA